MHSEKIYLYTVEYYDGKKDEGGVKTTAYTSLDGAKEEMAKDIKQFKIDLSHSEDYFDKEVQENDGLKVCFLKENNPNTDLQVFNIEEVDLMDSGNTMLTFDNYVKAEVESVLEVYGVDVSAHQDLTSQLIETVKNDERLWEDYNTSLVECISEDDQVRKLYEQYQEQKEAVLV